MAGCEAKSLLSMRPRHLQPSDTQLGHEMGPG
jgi:hypothetical protein